MVFSGTTPTLMRRLLLLSLLAPLAGAPPVRADDFVNRVNAPYRAVPEAKRSDRVILPLLVDFTEPPPAVADPEDASLLPATSRQWGPVEQWSTGEPQQALIEALKKVTAEDDFRRAMVFAQPYGVEGVDIDLVIAGLYTELGDPPTLADAEHQYLTKMRWLESLAHVEATRLAATGDVEGAVDLMIDWVMFSRQFADRQFYEEVRWAMESLKRALARVRDLAYRDSLRVSPGLSASVIIDDLDRLSDRGYLGVERLRIPQGDIIGAEQLLRRIIEPRGKAIPDVFGQNMARLAAGERPLRLFSEAAYWESTAALHAGWFESLDMVKQVAADWETRWWLLAHDPVFTTQSDYEKIAAQGPKFAVIIHLLRGIEDLFPLRRKIATEAAGTRTGTGIYGYHLKNGGTADAPRWPPKSTAIRPEFVRAMDPDPYSPSGAMLPYFVPIRDTPQGPRGELVPWEVQAFPPDHEPFQIPFRDDKVFILYSVGLDEQEGFCKYATQADPEAAEGDYLLWPPMVSLVRQRLQDAGAIR